jgi:hypothetical protein
MVSAFMKQKTNDFMRSRGKKEMLRCFVVEHWLDILLLDHRLRFFRRQEE